MALDLLPALSDETVRSVFDEELVRIAANIPEIAQLAEQLRTPKTGNLRLFAEQAALVFSADALTDIGLRDMNVQTRILRPSVMWGAFAGQNDFEPAVAGAIDWLSD